MKRRLLTSSFFVALTFLLGCGSSPSEPGGSSWIKVSTAPWPPRHFLSGTVFNNSMWVIGGLNCTPDASVTTYFGDVWTSGDGVNWTQTLSTASSPFGIRYGHRVLSLNGKMYLIGGNSGAPKNDVWSSTDGVNWTNILPNSFSPGPNQFTARMDFGAEVFNNLLWVIGGFPDTNDVWNSPDGITWTKVLANGNATPTHFHKRWGQSTAVLNNKLYVIGGASGGPPATASSEGYQDVWSSPDGITWTQVYPGSSFGALYYHQSVVNNNKIWLTCGWGWPLWGARDWVGSSPDGANWTFYPKPPFPARFYHLSLSFNGAVWIMGGMGADNPPGTRVFFNDVWESQ